LQLIDSVVVVNKEERQGPIYALGVQPPAMRTVDLHEFAKTAARLVELILAFSPKMPRWCVT